MCLPHPPINNSLPWIEDSLNLTPILAILVRLATLAHLATLAPLATLATHVILATWPHCPCYRRCSADHSSLSIPLSLALHPEGSSCLSFQPKPLQPPADLEAPSWRKLFFSFQPDSFQMSLKLQPARNSWPSFQSGLLSLLLILQLHPEGSCCSSFQSNFFNFLSLPTSSLQLTIEFPSIRQSLIIWLPEL